jgi:hypothetical protein
MHFERQWKLSELIREDALFSSFQFKHFVFFPFKNGGHCQAPKISHDTRDVRNDQNMVNIEVTADFYLFLLDQFW